MEELYKISRHADLNDKLLAALRSQAGMRASTVQYPQVVKGEGGGDPVFSNIGVEPCAWSVILRKETLYLICDNQEETPGLGQYS
jgi:hypothetical protein